MSNPEYEVVWPRGKVTTETVKLAKRLDTLEGKTIAFVWDYIFRGDLMFPVIERELAKRYPGSKFIGYDMFGSIHGFNEASVLASLPDNLKHYNCDAVVCGVGC